MTKNHYEVLAYKNFYLYIRKETEKNFKKSKKVNQIFKFPIEIPIMDKTIFSIEYDFNNVSASLLWDYIHTPDGLSTWFADDVVINGKSYLFSWNGEHKEATQICLKNGVTLKLRWNDETNKKYYFEFNITTNELTQNITLIITDFASEGEKEDLINLWNEQISILRKKLGA